MVGDNGLMLRYVAEDHSVTTVTGSSQLVNLDMAAIAWNAAGSYAYVAGESGYIWAYYEGQDGQGVFEIINDEPGSDITDIACQEEAQMCAVTTETDGIALIDTTPTTPCIGLVVKMRRWLGVSCAEPVFNRCAAIGDGRAIGSLGLNSSSLNNRLCSLKSSEPRWGVHPHSQASPWRDPHLNGTVPNDRLGHEQCGSL